MNGITALINNFAQALNALFYYIVAGVSLLASNRYLLGCSILLLLFTGKQLKIGRIINAKG